MNNRVFGSIWSLIILGLSLSPLLRGQSIHLPTASAALLLALVTLVAPRLLTRPNRLWIHFGKLMHGIISNVALFLIYFLFLTPGAVLLRLCGRNELKLKIDPKATTYWNQRSSDKTDFNRPY
ncbi:SxtJ family membrane protein [Roseateles sp. LYH14W]|uniref:SxtJ family membrane protein n=1 Tax=Pelomonas parva TaxID=3299032 RepID=A0ABW7F9I4_9BURK